MAHLADYRSVHSSSDLVAAINDCNKDYATILDCGSGRPLSTRLRCIKHLAIDFDKCMSTENQWQRVRAPLSQEIRDRLDEDMYWYYDQFANDPPPPPTSLDDPNWLIEHSFHENRAAIEGAWIERAVRHYVREKMTKDHFLETGKRMRLRKGAVALFELTDQHAVISMGIKQVIQACLDANHLSAAVAGTHLRFEKHGRLIGCHRNVAISSTKTVAIELFQKIIGADADEILAMGDSVTDGHMMPENGFNVFFIPTDDLQGNKLEFRLKRLHTIWHKLQLVLVADSFMPLVNLISRARSV